MRYIHKIGIWHIVKDNGRFYRVAKSSSSGGYVYWPIPLTHEDIDAATQEKIFACAWPMILED